MEAFSRDGIPAFLNRQLCPILNKAASHYSELFSDNEIQIQFKVEKGEFIPQIINPKGGESIEDQSTGERALAGLIASFALREVAPRCNLLVLDEPGEGLDSQTAKQFARALQHLVKRFKSIWVVTHNQNILSELSGERTLTVVKQNGISTLKEN
jgi:DNA repair exonuclease SbcCD ATPase subunit